MDRTSLENLIREQIPLAKAMDVRVSQVAPPGGRGQVELRSALEPNHNHVGTAFGGSLSSLMILAAYCQLFHLMDGRGHVLLKNCALEFQKPVSEELCAVCFPPTTEEIQKFLHAYRSRGRARLALTSEIWLADGTVACRLHGEFVGVPPSATTN